MTEPSASPNWNPPPELTRALLRKVAVAYVWWDMLCAGVNRHGVENERVLQERSSDPS